MLKPGGCIFTDDINDTITMSVPVCLRLSSVTRFREDEVHCIVVVVFLQPETFVCVHLKIPERTKYVNS